MRLVVSRLAAQKVGGIADYIRRHDPGAALRVEAALRNAFAMLAGHPYAGRRVGGVLRRFVLPRYPS